MFRKTVKCIITFNSKSVSLNRRNNSFNISNKSSILKSNLNILNFQRNIYVSAVNKAKLFRDVENDFAFKIVNKDSLNISDTLIAKSPVSEVTTLEDFNSVLHQNWRKSSITEIVKTFKSVKNYCIENAINISDNRFDKLVDGLMDQCEKISDTELYDLLECLSELPPCEGIASHNFHDVWSCLDDICCWKMIDWDVEKSLMFANLWYTLHLGRVSDYIFVLIDRLVKQADKLSKEHLVKILFYFNVCRKRAVDFEYEYALHKQISNMNVDEMAVVAMGYFKTQTKIKVASIIEAMIQRVKENSKNIHEISLTAIIKIIRFSKPIKNVSQVLSMLDQLYVEMDRLSNLCCLHIALIGTGIQVSHNKTILKASEKFIKDISNPEKVRVKDIERILNVLSMFCIQPKTEPDFLEAAFQEIHKEERRLEFIKYPKCLTCALNYFSIKNMYSYELMNKVLDIEYINEVYGKGSRCLPRELLSLDASIDAECPDYKGNRLPAVLRHKATKWVVDYIPSFDQKKKITAADQLFLDVLDTVKEIIKDESLMKTAYILPHFSRADIILCKEKKSGKFVQPFGFENYQLGDVMFPYKDESLEWYAIVILCWNNTVRSNTLPLGNMVMKRRQLEKIGYKTIFVIWNEFFSLPKENQAEYILSQIP